MVETQAWRKRKQQQKTDAHTDPNAHARSPMHSHSDAHTPQSQDPVDEIEEQNQGEGLSQEEQDDLRQDDRIAWLWNEENWDVTQENQEDLNSIACEEEENRDAPQEGQQEDYWRDQVEYDEQDQEYHKGSVEECTISQECMEGDKPDDPETEQKDSLSAAETNIDAHIDPLTHTNEQMQAPSTDTHTQQSEDIMSASPEHIKELQQGDRTLEII